MTIKAVKLNEILHQREFYELMQTYRHAPFTPQVEVIQAFEDVITFIITELEKINRK